MQDKLSIPIIFGLGAMALLVGGDAMADSISYDLIDYFISFGIGVLAGAIVLLVYSGSMRLWKKIKYKEDSHDEFEPIIERLKNKK